MTKENNISKMPSFAEKLDDLLVRYLACFNYKNYANRLNLRSNERILEVGCGGGNLSRFLSKKLPKGKLICIDNSEYWIKEAKRRLRGFWSIELNFEDFLSFNTENYFDIAVVHYVLHDINEKERAIDVLNKSLKPKGRIYVREPTRKNHGMSSTEIEELMFTAGLEKLSSREGYSFPIRGKVYEGLFAKCKSQNL